MKVWFNIKHRNSHSCNAKTKIFIYHGFICCTSIHSWKM